MKIGYGRVSTRDQNPDAQRDALAAAGCDPVFVDRASGKLASSLEHLITLSRGLQEHGVDLVVLDQGIDTSTAVGRMFFQILGAIAEFEHALISERTMDGLAAARARGRTGGQKPKLTPRQARRAQEMYDETGPDGKRRYTVAQIAAEFGVTRPTIYRHVDRERLVSPL
jgi:DNA invertase Pin-like site-specific DNA recombinase